MSDKRVSVNFVTVVANDVKPDIDIVIGHKLLTTAGD
jgi:hypothetical protein